MPAFILTASQQKALDDQRNIVVTASAGSGKTATLVSRYLKLLEHPEVGVRNVLAITFTEKAATEMKERIGNRILEELSGTSDPARRARLAALRDDLNGAHLSTIHAFCAALLREHPLEAGVDPGFAIADEMQRMVMTREAVEGALMDVAEGQGSRGKMKGRRSESSLRCCWRIGAGSRSRGSCPSCWTDGGRRSPGWSTMPEGLP